MYTSQPMFTCDQSMSLGLASAICIRPRTPSRCEEPDCPAFPDAQFFAASNCGGGAVYVSRDG